jgi:hypothetical protein
MPEEFMMNRPEPKKDRGHLVKILVIVILCAVLFGAIGYVLGNKKTIKPETPVAETAIVEASEIPAVTSPTVSASTSQTASWKTYTNDTYGFSFQYPNDWTILSDTAGTNGSVKNKLEMIGSGKEDFSLWVNPDGFGFEAASDMYQAEILNGKISIINHTENQPSAEFPELSGQAVIGTLTSSNITYVIAYSFDLADRTEELVKFEKIIKSFQFTK